MSEYKELIRQFDKIRTYVRDFYVYGFKTREDYQEKSGRTYDNQRRRIESWFSDYIRTGLEGHKKSVFLTLDSSRIPVNPLYHAWKSKTFTDNDITLRFFLLDLLAHGGFRSLEDLADELSERCQRLTDTQTIRRKLSFFEKEGLVVRKKEGRQYLYGRSQDMAKTHPGLLPALTLAVGFFQGASPFGFIGSTILDFWKEENKYFRFRSDYLVHTLEDEILLPLLHAMEEKCRTSLMIKSIRGRHRAWITVTPLKILTSTQTGRRYVCAWRHDVHRLASFRLDSVQSVEFLDADPCYDTHMEAFQNIFPYMWGVSLGNVRIPETIRMEIRLDEQSEDYILSRLQREGRGGALKRLEPGLYEYTRLCLDGGELLPWVKSFTGRIVSFHCSNPSVENRLWDDMKIMADRYLRGEENLRNSAKNQDSQKGPVGKDQEKDRRSHGAQTCPLFSELYSCYYQAVARILEEAKARPLTQSRITQLAGQYGYDESALSIVPKLMGGDWPLLKKEETVNGYRSLLKNPLYPQPLTGLQKSWLKALLRDPRFPLFFTDAQTEELEEALKEEKPLFRMRDFCLFDQYSDHDPFSSFMYRQHMHVLLEAMREQRFLSVTYLSRKGNLITRSWLPCRLEYGQKDGKFWLYGLTSGKNRRRQLDILNVARIVSLQKTDSICPDAIDVDNYLEHALCREPLVLEITTERNALERTMLHFSCYQKEVERSDSGVYRCTVYYDKRWETELLIQVLSFGPVVTVLGPESFLGQVRERVALQAEVFGL